MPGRRLTSIFFGGGTPSLMDPRTVEALIAAAFDIWTPAEDIEITLEANPNSVEAARFADLRPRASTACRWDFRASMTRRLRFLGRAHSAREGFARSRDRTEELPPRQLRPHLRLPATMRTSWSATLAQALSLGTSHLSLYQLTIEPGTRFATMVARGQFEPLDADAAAALYELTDAMTSAAGMPGL